MDEEIFHFSPLFVSSEASNYRIPSVTVTKRGTVVAFANDRRGDIHDRSPEHWVVCRRQEAGKAFEETRVIFGRKDWRCMLGAAFYDEEEDKILCLFNMYPNSPEAIREYESLPLKDRPHTGTCMAESRDDGKTFLLHNITVLPNRDGFFGNTHGSAAGIQIRHGKHKGRLISAGRYNTPPPAGMDFENLQHLRTGHFNCSVYSDDHGKTWHTGGRVQTGTGEGCLCETQDGKILLNSRAYFYDGFRRSAWSEDGGETFGNFQLTEDITEISGGVNASLISVALPDESEIVVYASVNNRKDQLENGDFSWQNPRKNVSIWISFDGGHTFPMVKSVYKGPSAYNSLCYDASRQRFIMLLEYGKEGETCYQQGIGVAEFNLRWALSQGPSALGTRPGC